MGMREYEGGMILNGDPEVYAVLKCLEIVDSVRFQDQQISSTLVGTDLDCIAHPQGAKQ